MFSDPSMKGAGPARPGGRLLIETALADPSTRRQLHRAILIQLRPPNQEAQAAEVVSEVAVRALQSHHRYDPDRGTVLPWLVGIAGYILLERQRNEIREHLHILRQAALEPPSWEHLLESLAAPSVEATVDNQLDVHHYLDSLSVGDRALLKARYYNGLDYSDLATLLKLTPSAVRLRVFRALQQLRERFHQPQERADHDDT
jgi:RNA polymerase sigma-70 factor (ECF subfamily)